MGASEIQGWEKLFRAVRSNMLKGNGRPTTAAFKTRKKEKELSFDRQANRDVAECIRFMRSRLEGAVFSIPAKSCTELDLTVEPTPSQANPYHASVYHGSYGEIPEQTALALARSVQMEAEP